MPKVGFPYWYDAIIVDTERLLLSFLDTAVQLGQGRVQVRNYTVVEEFMRRQGRIVAARISGLGELSVGVVLDCTGVSRRGQPAGVSMNLVVGQLALSRSGSAVALHHPVDKRKVFVVPWRGCNIIGTYDRDYPHDPSEPLRLDHAWIDEFLAWIGPVHPELARLSSSDIRVVHAGLLPRESSISRQLARHYRIHEEPDGTVRVEGVKYTTARSVCSRAVEIAAHRLGKSSSSPRDSDPLPKLIDYRISLAEYLSANQAFQTAVLDAYPKLCVGSVIYAIEREQARTVSDVLFRRTGIATVGHPGAALVESVAALLQQRLGWSAAERNEQIEAFNNSPWFVSSGHAD
jgi:glycerol-3-phosphate dehydrogenase